MAIRKIRMLPDEMLHKTSRPIDVINDHILTLLDDMAETMYDDEGVGLAAVQVGVLRRAVVIDIGTGLMKMINPVIVAKDGTEDDVEGCLSVPGYQGVVSRPVSVSIEYLDPSGNSVRIENATGMLKKAICHELDHLDGIVYTDIAKSVYELKDDEIENGEQATTQVNN